MQTFVPIATTDFTQIAEVLDNKRLNKQALEGWQILMTLLELDPQGNDRKPKGWANHPAVKMWRGYEVSLFMYIQAMTEEWRKRGFKTTIDTKAATTISTAFKKNHPLVSEAPLWMRDSEMYKDIAVTHRKALLVKDYAWYHQFGWPEDSGVVPSEYDYKWPV